MKPKQTSAGFWLYGIHPIEMALQNPKRRILEIRFSKHPSFKLPQNIPAHNVSKEQIESIVGRDVVHQGIIAHVQLLETYTIDDLITDTKHQSNALVIMLDQVSDPHNIGAIMRSGVAFGATALILPDSNAPQESGTLAKSASGALEILPLIRVTNLVRTMEQLKKADFWCVGMDGYAKKSIVEQKLPNKCALVMGSEGDGLRRLTMENCDYLTKLPMSEKMESLNVSNACAIALYEWFRLYKIRE